MGRDEVELLLSEHGAIRTGRCSQLRSTVERMLRDGELVTVLPGVHTRPDPQWRHRVVAVQQWDPSCVIAGRAAAALTFWPDLSVDRVDVLTTRRAAHPGYLLTRRTVEDGWIARSHGVRCTVPALTAIDLAVDTEGDSIDRCLRSRRASLDQLRAALAANPGRIDNPRRRRLLLDSRSEPWSAAERLGHRLLRRAGLHGWTANQPLDLEQSRYYPDIAFGRQRVVVEIDGDIHRQDRSTFIEDRRRQNVMQLNGWLVLRFTWFDLDEKPSTFIEQIRRALRLRITAPIAIR